MRYFAAPVVAVLVVLALAVGVVTGGEVGRWQASQDDAPVSMPGELALPEHVRDLLVRAGFAGYVHEYIEVLRWYPGLYDVTRGVEIGGEAHYGHGGRRVANIVFGDVIGAGEVAALELARRLVHEAAHFAYADRAYGDFYSDDGERYAQAIEARFVAVAARVDGGGVDRSALPSAGESPE